jgi:hypothetical protein
MTPWRRAAPLWSAVSVTGLADGTVALVMVLHHALADGAGGLTVLAHLIDAPVGRTPCAPGALRAELDVITRGPGPAGARPAGQGAEPPGRQLFTARPTPGRSARR